MLNALQTMQLAVDFVPQTTFLLTSAKFFVVLEAIGTNFERISIITSRHLEN